MTACFLNFCMSVTRGLIFQVEDCVRKLYILHGIKQFYISGKDEFMTICDQAIKNAQIDFPEITRVYAYAEYDCLQPDQWVEPENYFDLVDYAFQIIEASIDDQPLTRQKVLIDQCDCTIFYAKRSLSLDITNHKRTSPEHKLPQMLFWYAHEKGKMIIQL